MPLTTDEKLLTLSRDIIEGFDKADGGIHPGFRPAHAKGILLAGVFKKTADSISKGAKTVGKTAEKGAEKQRTSSQNSIALRCL